MLCVAAAILPGSFYMFWVVLVHTALHCTVAAAHPESNAIYANTLHCGSSSTIEKTEKIYYAWISVIMTLITNKI